MSVFDFDPHTIGGVLASAAARFGDREALVYDGRRATYAGLFDEAVERARALLGLGIKAGDHVGVLMPNGWDHVLLYYAANLIGARAVLLNARYRVDDLAYVIPKARIDILFVGGHAWPRCDFRPMLAEALPGLGGWRNGPLDLPSAPVLRMIVELGDSRPSLWPSEEALREAATRVSREDVLAAAAGVKPDDVGLMIFSSGTTSRPKACMLTHGSLSRMGTAVAKRFRLTPEDKIWDPLPLFHMSTMLPMAACRSAGACFIGMGHFNANEAVALLRTERPTIQYAAFPAIVSAIVDHPDFSVYDQSRLRLHHMVGPPDLLRRYADFFPEAVPINAYGLTEATGVPCYSALDDPAEMLFETCGRLVDGMEAMIVGLDGSPAPDGEPGEIWLRGFGVFAGYFDDPEETAKTITADGWLRTGDLGRIGSGGRLVYEGRIKDMLKIGGENVAATELESFLMTHPAIRMAQVIGVPDDRLMEVAAAFIELEPGAELSPDEVVRHCVGRIASYKVPRYIRFVADWPMSATKIQKFQLRRTFEPTDKIDGVASERTPAVNRSDSPV